MDSGSGRIDVLMNSAAGPASPQIEQIRDVLRSAGVHAEVRGIHPRDFTQAAQSAAQDGAAIVVAAGGDGTVSTVGAALAGTQTALGVLPCGTLNHFARDLGIPFDLLEAARVLAAGKVRQVDVVRVNERCFLNNSSIGLYPRIVEQRDDDRHRSGRSKWVAMGLAMLSVLRRYPLMRVRIDLPDRALACNAPLVFVGNNRYEMSLLNFGRRTALDRGELCVYLAEAPNRWAFLRLVLHAILGRLKQLRDFESMAVPHLRIETRKKSLRVALDGEVVRMTPPLDYQIWPKALKVIAP